MASALDLTRDGIIAALQPKPFTAQQKAEAMIRAAGIQEARALRAKRRLTQLEMFKASPNGFFRYLNEYLTHRHKQRPFLSTAEAVEFFKGEKRRLRAELAGKIEIRRPLVQAEYRDACERLVFARFFHRYGAKAWALEARAA